MFDIAVIGGGASGLVSAISAARKNENLNIAVVERLPRVGKKILATGNGRCNLSNENVKTYTYNTSLHCAKMITESFDAAEFFGGLGLFCRKDGEGRIYPYSNLATSVLDALRLSISKYGIKEICDFFVKDIISKKGYYEIISEESIIKAKKIIIACGGLSSPSMGTDGSILRLLNKKGISVTNFIPSLCPIITDEAKALKGIRAKCKVSLRQKERLVAESTGEVIFNDNNISGICIFDISSKAKEGMNLRIDLTPEYTKEELYNILCSLREIRKGLPYEDLMTGLFPKRLSQFIIKRAGGLGCLDTNISKEALKDIANIVKGINFTVKGTAQWRDSQVTCGGISGDEIKDTLELKKMPGVFVAGEIIDIDGICGGYNLNWAWASGFEAGKNAAE